MFYFLRIIGLYVYNLVSVSCLVEHGLTLQFNSSVSIRSKIFFYLFR